MHEQLKINLFGVINVTNAVLPYMRARREGTIFIVGSRSAWRNEWPVSLLQTLIAPFVRTLLWSHRVSPSTQHQKRQYIVRNIILYQSDSCLCNITPYQLTAKHSPLNFATSTSASQSSLRAPSIPPHPSISLLPPVYPSLTILLPAKKWPSSNGRGPRDWKRREGGIKRIRSGGWISWLI